MTGVNIKGEETKDITQMLIPYDDPDGYEFVMNNCFDHLPEESRKAAFDGFLTWIVMY